MEYVKYLDRNTVLYTPQNLKLEEKTILNFKNCPELMLQYGYKPLVEAKIDYSRPFLIEFEEYENEIREVVIYDPLVDDDPATDGVDPTAVDPEQAE